MYSGQAKEVIPNLLESLTSTPILAIKEASLKRQEERIYLERTVLWVSFGSQKPFWEIYTYLEEIREPHRLVVFTSDLKEGTQAKLQLELLSQHLAWRRRASSLWAKRRLGRYLEETLSKRGPFQRKMPPAHRWDAGVTQRSHRTSPREFIFLISLLCGLGCGS